MQGPEVALVPFGLGSRWSLLSVRWGAARGGGTAGGLVTGLWVGQPHVLAAVLCCARRSCVRAAPSDREAAEPLAPW